jgi:hypothetical protein
MDDYLPWRDTNELGLHEAITCDIGAWEYLLVAARNVLWHLLQGLAYGVRKLALMPYVSRFGRRTGRWCPNWGVFPGRSHWCLSIESPPCHSPEWHPVDDAPRFQRLESQWFSGRKGGILFQGNGITSNSTTGAGSWPFTQQILAPMLPSQSLVHALGHVAATDDDVVLP